jgi:hypothetical protein
VSPRQPAIGIPSKRFATPSSEVREIFEFFFGDSQDAPWLFGNVLVFAWIGCWLATRGMSRPARFRQTLARGLLGGAAGGLLNPLHIVLVVYALSRGGATLIQLAGFALAQLAEGCVLSLPLAIFMAVRKGRNVDENRQ